jgi:hypothetical protein
VRAQARTARCAFLAHGDVDGLTRLTGTEGHLDAGAAADGRRGDEGGREHLVGLAVLALDHAVAAVLVEPAHPTAEHDQRSR